MSNSPILVGDLLVLLCDARTKPFLVAVDAKSGRVRWRSEREQGMESFSTPVVFTPPRGPAQVLVSGSFRLDAHSVETGERLWFTRRLGYLPKGVPVLGSNMVYVSAPGTDQPTGPPFAEFLQKYDADGNGRITREDGGKDEFFRDHFGFADTNGDGVIDETEYNFIRTAGVGDHGLVAIRLGGSGEVTQTNLQWRYTKTYPNIPAPLLYKGVLYLVKTGGIITSLDPATGDVFKTDRTKDALGEYFSSPVAADDKIFTINDAGKVTVLKAGRQWEILVVNDLGEECWATPAIAGGRIYIRTRNALYSFGKPGPR